MSLPNVYNRYRDGGSSRRRTDAVMQRQTGTMSPLGERGRGGGQHFPPISRFFFLFSFLIATRGKVLKSLCATFTGAGSGGQRGGHRNGNTVRAAHSFPRRHSLTRTRTRTHTPTTHTIINAIKYFSSETHKFPKAYGDVNPTMATKKLTTRLRRRLRLRHRTGSDSHFDALAAV